MAFDQAICSITNTIIKYGDPVVGFIKYADNNLAEQIGFSMTDHIFGLPIFGTYGEHSIQLNKSNKIHLFIAKTMLAHMIPNTNSKEKMIGWVNHLDGISNREIEDEVDLYNNNRGFIILGNDYNRAIEKLANKNRDSGVNTTEEEINALEIEHLSFVGTELVYVHQGVYNKLSTFKRAGLFYGDFSEYIKEELRRDYYLLKVRKELYEGGHITKEQASEVITSKPFNISWPVYGPIRSSIIDKIMNNYTQDDLEKFVIKYKRFMLNINSFYGRWSTSHVAPSTKETLDIQEKIATMTLEKIQQQKSKKDWEYD